EEDQLEDDRVVVDDDHIEESLTRRTAVDHLKVKHRDGVQSEQDSGEANPCNNPLVVSREHDVEHERGARKDRQDDLRGDELNGIPGDFLEAGRLYES